MNPEKEKEKGPPERASEKPTPDQGKEPKPECGSQEIPSSTHCGPVEDDAGKPAAQQTLIEIPAERDADRPPAPAKGKRPKKANDEDWPTWGLWRRLIRDKRISHGAFRLWHHLRDSMVAGSRVSEYWSQIRVLEQVICSKRNSIIKWFAELRANGLLKCDERAGTRGENIYTVLNGFGVPLKEAGTGPEQKEIPFGPQVMPSPVTQMGNNRPPISADAVTQKGNSHIMNSKGSKTEGSKPADPLRVSWMVEKELKFCRAEIANCERISGPESIESTSKKAEAKARLKGLKEKRRALEQEYDLLPHRRVA